MTHGTSGGLQHQPEPLLSQYLPVVPRPLIAQRRALAPLLQPGMLSGPCGQATPLAHTRLTSPGTTEKKPSLENCGNSLAWGSAWGTELFSQSAGMSQQLFASLQGAVTKGRCRQRGGGPRKGKALPVPGGWQGRLAHPPPAERLPKGPPLTHRQPGDVHHPQGCRAQRGAQQTCPLLLPAPCLGLSLAGSSK